MGKYSVPDYIRKMKPKGTIVKAIHGNYYVYEHFNRKIDGKWKSVSGKLLGTIIDGVGFIPNDNYNVDDEVTVYEYGQYALAYYNSSSVLDKLLEFFNPLDAHQIYFMALIYFTNGYISLKNIDKYFELSYLSNIYPDVSLTSYILAQLLDSLGRKQTRVMSFQQSLIDHSSSEMAIDGHVIRNCSDKNDLAEYGNKFSQLKDSQINVLMAYDINTNKPLFSRIFEGSELDKSSIKDIFGIYNLKNMLFIIDKGFYSTTNIQLFSSDGNRYIIPLPHNLVSYKNATEDMELKEVFLYKVGKKKNVMIQYKEVICKDNDKNVRIIVYRDLEQSNIEQESYLEDIEAGKKGCTKEEFNRLKDFFGVIVLQTNSENMDPKEIYEKYKKRWKIETFYNYIKNDVEIEALHLSDYYMMQGLSFILLIEGLIHSEFKKASKEIKGKSVNDILIEGRFIKVHKDKGKWKLENIKKERKELMITMNVKMEDVEKMK